MRTEMPQLTTGKWLPFLARAPPPHPDPLLAGREEAGAWEGGREAGACWGLRERAWVGRSPKCLVAGSTLQ